MVTPLLRWLLGALHVTLHICISFLTTGCRKPEVSNQTLPTGKLWQVSWQTAAYGHRDYYYIADISEGSSDAQQHLVGYHHTMSWAVKPDQISAPLHWLSILQHGITASSWQLRCGAVCTPKGFMFPSTVYNVALQALRD